MKVIAHVEHVTHWNGTINKNRDSDHLIESIR
jgi:hypothetical protein